MPSRPWPRWPRTIAWRPTAAWCRPDRTAGEVAAAVGLPPNTLTFHLDRLRQAGLVTVRREGRSMIYAARYDTMNALLGYLTENCCQGAKDACAPAAACKPAGSKRIKVPA